MKRGKSDRGAPAATPGPPARQPRWVPVWPRRHRKSMTDLRQAWPTPSHPRPIVIIGAGAIVRTAHLPAYRRLGLPVAGIFDINREHARATAQAFQIDTIFPSLEDAARTEGAVFDVAVPGSEIAGILERLPRGSAVLMQKPM